MREGCLIGCLGLIAVTMILAIVAVVALDGFFGLFREADRVSLTEFYGQDHDVMALVEPNFDLVGSAVAESTGASPWLVDWVLPYEVVFIVDVDRESSKNVYTVAASLKRMAGFLSYYLPRGEGLKMFGDAEVSQLGVNSGGLAFVEATAPIPPQILERSAPMSNIGVEAAYVIEGGYLAEIILNNASGNAFIALETLFPQHAVHQESELPVAPEQLELLGRGIAAAKLTFSEPTSDSVTLEVRARISDSEYAAAVPEELDKVIRGIAESEVHHGQSRITIEGNMQMVDDEVIGSYTLSHVRHRIGDAWRDRVEEFQRQLSE